ncbi:hypothetical protein L1987_60036 [Smallanthus sonchifolius]|uniref:Uncharacterized protein n=1 Tax=Smallanthus sonchifolius TaxID=185202 RepID=A0ACB9D7B0_9ASTR|nr:hypothetical protein L1987_60036 [Smallanthus sonchifolius]
MCLGNQIAKREVESGPSNPQGEYASDRLPNDKLGGNRKSSDVVQVKSKALADSRMCKWLILGCVFKSSKGVFGNFWCHVEMEKLEKWLSVEICRSRKLTGNLAPRGTLRTGEGSLAVREGAVFRLGFLRLPRGRRGDGAWSLTEDEPEEELDEDDDVVSDVTSAGSGV